MSMDTGILIKKVKLGFETWEVNLSNKTEVHRSTHDDLDDLMADLEENANGYYETLLIEGFKK